MTVVYPAKLHHAGWIDVLGHVIQGVARIRTLFPGNSGHFTRSGRFFAGNHRTFAFISI